MKSKKKKDSAEAIVRDLARFKNIKGIGFYYPGFRLWLDDMPKRARALLRAKKGGKP